MDCANIQGQLPVDAGCTDDRLSSVSDTFLKHDNDSGGSDPEDQRRPGHMGSDFTGDEMFRRIHAPPPVTTMGNDALDLSLTRHPEDSVDDDDFDDDEDDDDCDTGRGASPYLQATPNDNLLQLRPNLGTSSFLEESRSVWPDGEPPCSVDSGLPSNWHLPLNGPSAGLVGSGQDLDLLSGSSSLADEWPQDSKELAGVLMDGSRPNPWAVLHDTQLPLLHWGSGSGSPVVHMGQQSNSAHDVLGSRSLQMLHESSVWAGPGGEKAELDASWVRLTDGKAGLEHPDALEDSDDWEKQTRAEHQVTSWHKNMVAGVQSGEMYPDDRGHQSMYMGMEHGQKVAPPPGGFAVMTLNQSEQQQQQQHKFHYRVAIANDNNRMMGLPRPEQSIQLASGQQCPAGYFGRPPHHMNTFPVQQRAWSNAHDRAKGQTWEHVMTGPRSELEVSRAQLRQVRPQLVSTAPDPAARQKGNSSSHSKRSHPYKIKEQKAIVRDVQSTSSANVQTLKASHIVSWYIDYLIHENEDVTQISRAFSLPVNLFHSDDFYFMDTLKKKAHFPSLKFLSWMQQNFPSINVNAVDFHEGRPQSCSADAQGSGWGQDRSWDTKSRRDIIHDVFYYFQRQQQQQQMMMRS